MDTLYCASGIAVKNSPEYPWILLKPADNPLSVWAGNENLYSIYLALISGRADLICLILF